MVTNNPPDKVLINLPAECPKCGNLHGRYLHQYNVVQCRWCGQELDVDETMMEAIEEATV